MKKLYYYLRLMSIGIILVLSYRCSEKKEYTEPMLTKSMEVDTLALDTAYLGFEGDLHDPLVIYRNMETYVRANHRMVKHLSFKDNQLVWDFDSAEALNISQNIYDYIIGVWTRHNARLKSGEAELEWRGDYYILRRKKGGKMSRTGQILFYGQHRYNMNICVQTVRNASMDSWLGNYIDLYYSEMSPDYYGGYCIIYNLYFSKQKSPI